MLIGAGGEQDDAHSAAAELALHAIRSDLPILIRGRGTRGGGRCFGTGSKFFIVEAGGEAAEALIGTAGLVQEFLPIGRWKAGVFVQSCFDLVEGRIGHGPGSKGVLSLIGGFAETL